jgi:hypothetical protein
MNAALTGRYRRAGRQNTAEGRRYEQTLRRGANRQARAGGAAGRRGRAAGGRGG